MKVCLFGGTFDPPHLGHLIIAQTIFEAEKFDQIIFVPAFKPPHKNGIQISHVDYRLDMLKIAIKEKKKFQSHLQKEYIKEVLTKVIHGLYLPLLLGKQIQLIKKDILFYNNLI